MVALIHDRNALQLVHDLIHLSLHGPWEIAVGLFAFNLTQLLGQLPDHPLGLGVLTDCIPHLLGQFQHDFPSFTNQFIPGDGLLFVDMEQFLLEDVVGELRLHLANAISIQMRLSRFHRPRHHVGMWMVSFIVERCVPPEVLRRDVHSCRDVVAVRAE